MIATGISQSQTDWEGVKLLFPVGSAVEGRVVSVPRYGVFFDVGQPFRAFLDIAMAPAGFKVEVGEDVPLRVVQHLEQNRQLRVKVDDQPADPDRPSRINVDSSAVLELSTAYFASLTDDRRRAVVGALEKVAAQKATADTARNALVGNPVAALLDAGLSAESILKSIQADAAVAHRA